MTATDFDVDTTPGLRFNYFVLSADTLPENSITTFQLLCQRASTSIVVITNGPPQPGLFKISPSKGVELYTAFLFSASLWSDEDIPISYSFGFYATNTSTTVAAIKVRSEASFTSSNLPAGLDESNFQIRGLLLVYDSLSASSTAMNWVEVTRFVAADTSALTGAINAKLNNAMLSSPEDTLNFLSVASAVINFVNCSIASPSYCNKMNRYETITLIN